MKKTVLVLMTIILFKVTVFGQCDVTFSGFDPIWCMPCNGMLTAFTIGNPPYHYQWSTGDTSNTIYNLCAGTYTLTLTDSTGCTVIDYANLSETPPMNVNITTTPASCMGCNDGCITISVANGCSPYSYTISPYDPFWMPCTSFPGNYIVIVTDACGCTIQESVTVGFSTVVLNEQENSISLSYQIQNNTVTFSKPISNLTLYDSFGNLIFKFADKVETKQINLPELPTGIYLLTALTNNGRLWADKLLIIKE